MEAAPLRVPGAGAFPLLPCLLSYMMIRLQITQLFSKDILSIFDIVFVGPKKICLGLLFNFLFSCLYK